MDRKIFGIGILCVTAVILFVANLFVPTSVSADEAVGNRDYQAVTTRSQRGGESLYILDNRTGMIGVFVYDTGTKGLVLRGSRNVADAFQQ